MLPSSSALPEGVAGRFAALRRLIGDTPLATVRCRYRGAEHVVHAKIETLNFTGSIKDRMALYVMEDAYASGAIRPGDMIVEATSGNTGISFCGIGRALGHPVRIHMPDWMSRERVLIILSMGATIVPVSAAQGGFLGSIALAEKLAAERDDVFLPEQFKNPANVEAHYRTTGPELLAQVRTQGLEPTAFVAGVGTGGTVMGVGRFLREHAPGVRVHPLEPADSPTLRTGCKAGKHRIQGISDEFIPPIVDLKVLDAIVDVRSGDAIRMAQRLARDLGFGVGISSGANFLGALQVAHAQGRHSAVATVFPDSNKKYLSTDYVSEEPACDGDLEPDVELLGFDVVSAPTARE
jgi:cysteine synthase A